jgi:DNA mismatch repair protein MutS
MANKRKSTTSPKNSKPPKNSKNIKGRIMSGSKPKKIPIMKQYIKFYNEAIKKYGPNTAVLCQVGKFFEVYSHEADPQYATNIEEVGNIMGVVVKLYSSSAPASVTNPRRCGVQTDSVSSFKNKLLDEDYTVVIVRQTHDSDKEAELGPIKRYIDEVFSPGVNDDNQGSNYNNIIAVVIENQNPKERLIDRIDQYEIFVGMAAIDVSANMSTVYEIASSRRRTPELAANEIYRFLQTHNCRELVVHLEKFKVKDEKEEKKLKRYFTNALGLEAFNIQTYELNAIPKEFKKLKYKEQQLSKVFGDEVCGIGISPVEYLELEMYPNAVLAYCCLIDFIHKRNESYLKDLGKPKWWSNDTHLVLAHNAIQQLDIVSRHGKRGKHSSLLNIINHTTTNQGKRLLETQLLHPLLDHEELQTQYSQIEQFKLLGDLDKLRKKFKELLDFERTHRKLQLRKLSPTELYELIEAYGSLIYFI